jgi:hypothetical protein
MLRAALGNALVHLSQLLTDIDQVGGVELDPVHVEASGVVVLDAHIRVEPRGRRDGCRRFAIRSLPEATGAASRLGRPPAADPSDPPRG